MRQGFTEFLDAKGMKKLDSYREAKRRHLKSKTSVEGKLFVEYEKK
jgi:hypothetical protein